MPNNDKLQNLREQIDDLDAQLQELISQRARLATEIAGAKADQGDGGACYRPEREAEVLRKVIERNRGPLKDEDMVRLHREIMSACLALQQPLGIACLGPEGTFSQAAAQKHFGQAAQITTTNGINEVFRMVEAGATDYGVVPAENSTAGVINHTLDMLMQSPLNICGEVELPIHQHLLSRASNLAAVTQVYSHSQSLAQCRCWLETHLPTAEVTAVSSNAEAARRVMDEAGAAAIASSAAASIYEIPIMASHIEDEPANITRFLVIGHESPPPSGYDKTSILFSAPNQPGALHDLLAPFASQGISMTRIESRPSRREVWDYVFFVDIEGHAEDQGIAAALQALIDVAPMVKVLGSYPRAVP